MTRIGLFGTIALTLSTAVALAQTGGGAQAQGSGILVRHRAPTDRALDFQLAAIQAEFADMKGQKRASTRLVEGDTYSMRR